MRSVYELNAREVFVIFVVFNALKLCISIQEQGYVEELRKQVPEGFKPPMPAVNPFSGDADSARQSAVISPALQTPLRTSKDKILDASGKVVKLTGVSWSGAQDVSYVPCGLEKRSIQEMVAFIRAQGFNHVRLPWSNDMIHKNPTIRLPNPFGINTAKNSWYTATTRSMDVFDRVVAALDAAGLGIILDNHNTAGHWCCDGNDCEVQWMNYPLNCPHSQTEQQWIDDWIFMVKRYAKYKMVIGAELRNEPRNGNSVTTTWARWSAAATKCGNQVLKLLPQWLIFVDGIDYAGNLMGVRTMPVKLQVPNKLVYAYHSYSWYNNNAPDCYGCIDYNAFKAATDTSAGFINTLPTGEAAPIYVSEFGMAGFGYITVSPNDVKFLNNIARYMKEKGWSWAYWTICNTQPGRGYPIEGYSIANCDFTALVNDYRLPALKSIL